MAQTAAYFHKYYLDHKLVRLNRSKIWHEEHPEASDAIRRNCNIRIKTEVLKHYGPNSELRCAWPGCVVDDLDMLTLDHVNNDGAEERRNAGYGNRGGAGREQYRRIKRMGFPEGYQTMCWNHQWKKELMRRRGELQS